MTPNNPNIRTDCFNMKCAFHLKNGETVVGGVIRDNNNRFTVEQNDKSTKEFNINLVDSYTVFGPQGWDLKQTRGTLIGQTSAPIVGNVQCKKLIIFGAGASSDFGASNLGTDIPLTNDLFKDSELIQQFPGALNLRPKILTAVESGESLEDYFEEKWNEVTKNGDIDTLCKLINTQFFIHQYFWNVSSKLQNKYPNNYTKIARLIQKYVNSHENENIGVVTFNYDSLFENAVQHIFDHRFDTIDDYIFRREYQFDNLNPVMVFKPHGSWNWIHTFDSIHVKKLGNIYGDFYSAAKLSEILYNRKLSLSDIIFSIAPELKATDNLLQEIPQLFLQKFSVIDYNHKFEGAYFPNLLIPYSNKDNILMPKAHESTLRLKLENVEEVLIVGWKGTEKHFNETLKLKLENKKIKITYVSPYTQTTENELRKYLPNAEYKRYQGTFTAFLNEITTKKDTEYTFFK